MGFLSRKQEPEVAGYKTQTQFTSPEAAFNDLQADFACSLSDVRMWLKRERPDFDAMAEVQPNERVLLTFPVWLLGAYTYPAGGSYSGGSCAVAMDAEGRFYQGTHREARRAFSVFTPSTDWKPSRHEKTPAVPIDLLDSYYISRHDYQTRDQAMRELIRSIQTRYPEAPVRDLP